MKRQLSNIALSLALVGSYMGFSQNQNIQPCNTFAAMEEYFTAHPEARKSYEAAQLKLHKDYLEAEKNLASSKTAAVQFTIPVVFHVLHQGGAENITDAQCIAALKQMNSDYGRQGSDTNTIFAPFKALYVNSDIKFMLAHKDPLGNCTSGIEHLFDSRTDWSQLSAGQSASYYNGITWDPTKYLNLIIVKQIIPQSPVAGGGTIVGYTYKPGTFGAGNLRDAIVYNYGFLSGTNARSLSHEAGHWLNLSHTFGNTNNPGQVCGSTSGGDGISDTPDTKGNFSTCPASSTNTAYTCTSPNPGNANNYYQNVENIMDYSSCPKNFTQGQTTAMRNSIQSAISGRSNVISAGNITFTDVNSTGTCKPIANFISSLNTYTVCMGSTLQLKDLSYNGVITSYSWTGNTGVTFANATAPVTTATFATAGTATVNLTVSNSNGSSVKTQTVLVINPGTAVLTPFSEDFEAPLGSGWSIVNPNNDVTWAQTNTASYTGNNSYYIIGASDPASELDILNMPLLDLVNNPNDTLTFKYGYARFSGTNNDVFKVEASKDCGASWGTLFAPPAGNLASPSGGVSSTPFVPTLNQWVHVNLTNYPNWFNYSNSASVLIRFSFQESPSGTGGNNIYLDAINFSSVSAVGINELTRSVNFGLYPNPSNGEAIVKFKLNDPASIKIEVIDVLGKKVLPSTEVNYGSGEQSVSLNKTKILSAGIYFVNLSVNGAKMSKKLIIE